MQKKLHLLLALMLFFATSLMAQVTTSGINGKVVAAGETIIGATVTAVHVPSGMLLPTPMVVTPFKVCV